MSAWGDSTGAHRGRLRSSLLWIAAAVIGGASVYHTVSVVHDNTQRREAARQLILATEREIAVAAATRLELIGRDALQCGCSAGLTVTQFFAADLTSGMFTSRPVRADSAGSTSRAAAATDSVLRTAALTAAASSPVNAPPPGAPRVHLAWLPTMPSHVALVSIAYSADGRPRAVNGLLADTRSLVSLLFQSSSVSTASAVSSTTARTFRHGQLSNARSDAPRPLVTLDSLSFQVTDSAGAPLFGAVDTTRALRAMTTLHGPLAPLRLVLTLSIPQIEPSMIGSVAVHELWLLGVLQFSTILLIGLAVGSTRREALLARARSDFVAGVSHDLRMPLAQILLSSETLTMQRERNEDERRTLVTSIVREARRLVGLIDNVLLFARSGAVALKPRLTPVAVSELFEDSSDAMQLAADDLGQTIHVESDSRLTVMGDRHLLRQAIVNLLDNALKYGRHGQAVQLRATESAPGVIQIQVDDEGMGIPFTDRARVFEPYARLARDQTSERTGTGLGLSIVRDVARACNGRAWLEQAAGGGTRAILELRSADAPPPP